MRRKNLLVIAVAAALCGALSLPAGASTDTTFTYQGELKSSDELAQGSFNMDFSLWNALAGGTQIGSVVNLPNVAVSEGQFTVKLDFGANAFDNNGRWLQIAVNGTTLNPRQELTRSPYSIQTRGIFVNDNGAVGIGTTTPAADLHVRGDGDGAVLRLTNGGGGGTALVIGDVVSTGRAATVYGITSDTLVDVRNDGTGPAAVFNGFVGVGRDDPINSNEVFGLYKNTTGFAGMYIETPANGDPFYGYSAGGEVDAYTWYEGPTNIWRLTMNGVNRIGVNGNNGTVNVTNLDVSTQATFGTQNTHPAFAYGKVAANGTLISGSSNVASVAHTGEGRYLIYLDTPLTASDVLISSSPLRGVIQTLLDDEEPGAMRIAAYALEGGYTDVEFSFLVYRP
jgi:hypothetical protein